MILPETGWRTRTDLIRLTEALGAAEGQVRFVGGAVRDALLGLPVSDLDLATTHLPEDVSRRVKAAGFKAVPTGIAHGTITAVLPSGPVEVTTLRRDVSTDGRRATVAFTDDWREDAARRDFTINALSADPLSGGSTIISAGWTISRSGWCASSATRFSASRKIICVSCASSVSMRASVRALPTRPGWRPAWRAPTI